MRMASLHGYSARRAMLAEATFAFQEACHLGGALASFQVGEHERPAATDATGVLFHHLERGADVRGEIDLVDDEQVGTGDAGAALPRDLLALRYIDDVDCEVGELWAEGGGQVVAAGFDQDQVEGGILASHAGDGGEVDGGILADGGVRAAARLHA